jgi:hypothetical protein
MIRFGSFWAPNRLQHSLHRKCWRRLAGGNDRLRRNPAPQEHRPIDRLAVKNENLRNYAGLLC